MRKLRTAERSGADDRQRNCSWKMCANFARHSILLMSEERWLTLGRENVTQECCLYGPEFTSRIPVEFKQQDFADFTQTTLLSFLHKTGAEL